MIIKWHLVIINVYWQLGRVLNRFSKDIGQMDDLLPYAFYDYSRVRALSLFMSCYVTPLRYVRRGYVT